MAQAAKPQTTSQTKPQTTPSAQASHPAPTQAMPRPVFTDFASI
jgi:hypothetical protein